MKRERNKLNQASKPLSIQHIFMNHEDLLQLLLVSRDHTTAAISLAVFHLDSQPRCFFIVQVQNDLQKQLPCPWVKEENGVIDGLRCDFTFTRSYEWQQDISV